MKLLEIELAAPELCLNGLTARFRKTIDVEKVTGAKVGVHAGLSFLAIAIESRESFWFGLVRGSEGRQKPECGCKKR